MIDVFVMAAMFARPHQDRILESSRTKNDGEESDRQTGPKRDVGKEPVVTERDAEPTRGEEPEKDRDLKPIEAEMPKIKRHRGESQKQGTDEKRARCPVHACERDAKEPALNGLIVHFFESEPSPR